MQLSKNKKQNNEDNKKAKIWFIENSSNIRISRIPEEVLDDLVTLTDKEMYFLAEDVVNSYFFNEFYETREVQEDFEDGSGCDYSIYLEEIRRRDFSHFKNSEEMLDALIHRANSMITVISIARRSGSTKMNDFMLWDCIYADSRNTPAQSTSRPRKPKKKPAKKKVAREFAEDSTSLIDEVRQELENKNIESMRSKIAEIKRLDDLLK